MARRKASRSPRAPKATRRRRKSCRCRDANDWPIRAKSITHKFSVAGHEGYITVGLYPDGRPGELFITMAKEGSTIGGLMDAFGTAVSMSLQYGVPLEVLREQVFAHAFRADGAHQEPRHSHRQKHCRLHLPLAGHRVSAGLQEANKGLHPEELQSPAKSDDLEGSGFGIQGSAQKAADGMGGGTSQRPTIAAKPPASPKPTAAKSPASAKHSGANGNGKKTGIVEENAALLHRAGVAMHIDQNSGVVAREEQFASFQLDAPSCDNCGAITVRNGNCYLCHNCGNSMGCS